MERKIGTGGDLGSSAASSGEELSVGDTIWVKIENLTDGTNCTLKHSSVNIMQV